MFLQELGLSPWKMTIDCSYVEVNALQSVFPAIPIQWCTYHVGQAIWKNLQTRVKLQKTEDSKRLRSDGRGRSWIDVRKEVQCQLIIICIIQRKYLHVSVSTFHQSIQSA